MSSDRISELDSPMTMSFRFPSLPMISMRFLAREWSSGSLSLETRFVEEEMK